MVNGKAGPSPSSIGADCTPARAAKFAQTAGGFDAEVTVTRKDMTVTADSIMGLMMLAAAPGSDLELKARGTAASAALDALAQLVARRFDENV